MTIQLLIFVVVAINKMIVLELEKEKEKRLFLFIMKYTRQWSNAIYYLCFMRLFMHTIAKNTRHKNTHAHHTLVHSHTLTYIDIMARYAYTLNIIFICAHMATRMYVCTYVCIHTIYTPDKYSVHRKLTRTQTTIVNSTMLSQIYIQKLH